MTVAITIAAAWAVGIPLYLAWRSRKSLRAGELQAWWDAGREAGYQAGRREGFDAGRQAAIDGALRLARESDQIVKADFDD